MRWLAVIALAGCGSMPPASVRPTTGDPSCSAQLFVGQLFQRRLAWTCEMGQWGRAAGTCDRALEATAACEGVECTATVAMVGSSSKWEGERRIEVMPKAPGQLQLFVDLHHAGGFQERYIAADCEVLPVPEIVMTCQTRDPATGAFVTCSKMTKGAEVHLEVVASISSGSAVPRPDIFVDGREIRMTPALVHSPTGEPEIACHDDEVTDPRRRTMRCSGFLDAGAHRFTAKIDKLPEQALDVFVGVGR